MSKTILVTGGAGYIGTHTCVELIQNGYQVVVIDNYINSSSLAMSAVEEITKKSIHIYNTDIRDSVALKKIFKEHSIDAIIHFAGLKAIGKSVADPLQYYSNNISGTIALLEVAKNFGCKNFIFSSSASVYGNPEKLPISENDTIGKVTNPYAYSKLIIENILTDLHNSDNSWKTVLLRYFNPVGAHKSGKIGENPNGIPNNLMPFIAQVAIGKLDKVMVFGGNYATNDGTGVRDYIHVEDLSNGHVCALEYILPKVKGEVLTLNLGTGVGYSVLEVINKFSEVSGKEIPYEIIGRRKGDVDICFADVRKAKNKLNWSAKLGLGEMCLDTWKFVRKYKN